MSIQDSALPSPPPGNAGWHGFGRPDLKTLAGARAAAFYGTAAAAAMAAWTLAGATWANLRGPRPLGHLDGTACLEVLLFAAAAYGIHRGSRCAALAALFPLAWDRLYLTGPALWTPGISVDVLGLVLLACHLMAIRGTFALHQIQAPKAAPAPPQGEPAEGDGPLTHGGAAAPAP